MSFQKWAISPFLNLASLLSLLWIMWMNSFKAAIAKGCEEIMPVSDQFFGDRHGHLKDPFGYIWTVSSYIRDVTDNEINNALNEYVKNL